MDKKMRDEIIKIVGVDNDLRIKAHMEMFHTAINPSPTTEKSCKNCLNEYKFRRELVCLECDFQHSAKNWQPIPPTQTDEELLKDIICNWEAARLVSCGGKNYSDLSQEILKHFVRREGK